MDNLKIIQKHLEILGEITNPELFSIPKNPDFFKKRATIHEVFEIHFSKYGHIFGNSFEGTSEAINHFLELFNANTSFYSQVIDNYSTLFKEFNIIDHFEKTKRRNSPYFSFHDESYLIDFNELNNFQELFKNYNILVFLPILSVNIFFQHLYVDEPTVNIILRLPYNKDKSFYYKYQKSISGEPIHYFSNAILNMYNLSDVIFKEFEFEHIDKIIKNKYIKQIYISNIKRNSNKFDFPVDIKFNDFDEIKGYYDTLLMMDI